MASIVPPKNTKERFEGLVSVIVIVWGVPNVMERYCRGSIASQIIYFRRRRAMTAANPLCHVPASKNYHVEQRPRQAERSKCNRIGLNSNRSGNRKLHSPIALVVSVLLLINTAGNRARSAQRAES